MQAIELSDDPWTILQEVAALNENLPALINCHTCRSRWHVGIGTDGPPEWDRFASVSNELRNLGLEAQMTAIEAKAQHEMEELWNE